MTASTRARGDEEIAAPDPKRIEAESLSVHQHTENIGPASGAALGEYIRQVEGIGRGVMRDWTETKNVMGRRAEL